MAQASSSPTASWVTSEGGCPFRIDQAPTASAVTMEAEVNAMIP